MAKVVLGMTMSIDGYINDRDGSVDRLYRAPQRFTARIITKYRSGCHG
ncbi:hypothetical protein [Alteribacillus sp. HJP-4]